MSVGFPSERMHTVLLRVFDCLRNDYHFLCAARRRPRRRKRRRRRRRRRGGGREDEESESNKNLLGSNLCQQNVTIIVERIPSHVKGKWNVSIIKKTFGTTEKHLF